MRELFESLVQLTRSLLQQIVTSITTVQLLPPSVEHHGMQPTSYMDIELESFRVVLQALFGRPTNPAQPYPVQLT